jgi:hypothetical protein
LLSSVNAHTNLRRVLKDSGLSDTQMPHVLKTARGIKRERSQQAQFKTDRGAFTAGTEQTFNLTAGEVATWTLPNLGAATYAFDWVSSTGTGFSWDADFCTDESVDNCLYVDVLPACTSEAEAYFVVENGDANESWTFNFYVTEDDCSPGEVVAINSDTTHTNVSLGGPGEITWLELDVSTTAGKLISFDANVNMINMVGDDLSYVETRVTAASWTGLIGLYHLDPLTALNDTITVTLEDALCYEPQSSDVHDYCNLGLPAFYSQDDGESELLSEGWLGFLYLLAGTVSEACLETLIDISCFALYVPCDTTNNNFALPTCSDDACSAMASCLSELTTLSTWSMSTLPVTEDGGCGLTSPEGAATSTSVDWVSGSDCDGAFSPVIEYSTTTWNSAIVPTISGMMAALFFLW